MKKLALIILILLTSACNVDYHLSFDNNFKVKETLTIKESKSNLKNNEIDPLEYLKNKINLYEEAGVVLDSYKIIDQNDYIGLEYSKKHDTLEDLLKTSDVLKHYKIYAENDTSSKTEGNLFFVISEDFNQYFGPTNDPLAIKEIDLRINLQKQIIKTNADEKDLSNYIWSMNYQGDIKRIELSYKKTDNQKTKKYILIISSLIILALVILFISSRIKKKKYS